MPDDQESEKQARQEEEEDRHRRRGEEDDKQELAEEGQDQRGHERVADEERVDEDDHDQVLPEATSGEVTIPQIALEEQGKVVTPTVDVYEPEGETEAEREILIPKMELVDHDPDTASVELDVEEPTVEIKEKDWHLPLVRLSDAPVMQMQVASFDTEIRKPERSLRQRVRVPLYWKASKPQVRADMELDTGVQSQVRQLVEQQRSGEEEVEGVAEGEEGQMEEQPLEQKEREPNAVADAPEIAEGRGSNLEELPDPFELIFAGGGSLDTDKALVIGLADQEGTHIGVLRTLCKRIYREKKGGKPDPVIIRDLERFTGGSRGKGEIPWMKAEDQIFSVQLGEDEWETLIEDQDEDWDRIWNRIDELFAQSFGVLIFNNRLHRVPTEQEHLIQVVDLEPRRLTSDVQRDIAQLCWGYVDVSEASDFNMVFDYAREMSEQRLKEAGTDEGGIFRDATDEHDGPESDLHLRIKWFIVRLLAGELRDQGLELETPMQIEEEIATEAPIPSGSQSEDVVADVKCGREAYEVETLFAGDREGSDPRNKLRETFRKYEDADIDVVHIVLDNLTFHRHLKNIVQLKRNHRDWEDEQGIDVRFETLGLKENNLIGLDETIKRLKDVKEQVL